jgi:uncharacterized delta-60 repeat protein
MKTFVAFLVTLLLTSSVHSLPSSKWENSFTRSPFSHRSPFDDQSGHPIPASCTSPAIDQSFSMTDLIDPLRKFINQGWETPESRLPALRSHSARSSFAPLQSFRMNNQQYLSEGVETAWVQHYGSGFYPSRDVATAMAIDRSGNVYVTGYSSGPPRGVDCFTLKYDASGTQIWTARYSGPGNGDDQASAIAVDDSGNVYVTGYSLGLDTGWDFATIKYNAAGAEQWVVRFDAPGSDYDQAVGIALDGSGNAYVTGYSFSLETGFDYATTKYNAAGAEQWLARYNGPGNGYDQASAIAVDILGNVYVAGESYGSGTNYDYATIKYTPFGVEQWVARYDGAVNSGDRANAIAVDVSGNVYVTGESYVSKTKFDYATVKYDEAGVEQWVTRYNGPGNDMDNASAIALDNVGNVYVTGYSYGITTGPDYATIKYNSVGVEQWSARYSGPGYDPDWAFAIALDCSGNIYVTGYSIGSINYPDPDYVTIKYNHAGIEQWIARYHEPGDYYDIAIAIAVDASGNVHVTGKSDLSITDSDYATIKYNTEGMEQWIARFNGSWNANDHASAITLDSSGNVYVTGYSRTLNTATDYATIMYNGAGVQQWATCYDDQGNDSDEALAIAVDGSGNVCVTGRGAGAGTGYDYVTIKYSATGVELWSICYNGPGNDEDCATAIAVDRSGTFYVTGYSTGSGTGYDYATIKYNPEGAEMWSARYNGPGSYNDRANAIAVDGLGNVYVTGQVSISDYATVKYNAAGVKQWVAFYNGPGNSDDRASAIAVSTLGNVYVTGTSYNSGSLRDYATIKYSPEGLQQWVARYDDSANYDDYATAIAVDELENVYVTGTGSGGANYATIKYNIAGEEQWIARYTGHVSVEEQANAIALDSFGNVYVTGVSYGSETSRDYATVKYDAAGIEQWVARYSGPSSSDDQASGIAIDESGNVYVTGTSKGNSWSVYTTIKYAQTRVAIKEQQGVTPTEFLLSPNFPNPFNSSTIIQYQLPQTAEVELCIFDLQGHKVTTLVKDCANSGSHQLIWNGSDESGRSVASGIYFYQLKTIGVSAGSRRSLIATRKMLLLR